MALQKKPSHRGPGLLYILGALVVVALAASRFLGFGPPGADRQGPAERPNLERPAPGRPGVLPDPAMMTQVLILHTHTTENYSPKEPFAARGPGDVVEVGKALATALEREDVGVVHVQTVHDLPEWNQAYAKARQSIQDALARNNGVRAVLDIHRDAVESPETPGFATVEVDGQRVARILFIVGSTDNPQAQENLKYAQRLQEVLERMAPGIVRAVRVMARETNQDLHPHAVIAYVGDHRDSTLEEARRSAEYLARAVVELLREDG